jgi:mannose-1-phosphate guanylyltransferase
MGPISLLEQTHLRATRNVPDSQILFSVTASHRAFYSKIGAARPEQLLVQPANKGTVPAILFGLLSIERHDPDALVSILPADHHIADERSFSSTLDRAFDVAAQTPGPAVILGAVPDVPERDSGWIETGPAVDMSGTKAFTVRSTYDTPPLYVAIELFQRGGLWNTSVVVGHVRTLLDMLTATVPDLVRVFRRMRLGGGSETHIDDSLYRDFSRVDFCARVLAVQARRLLALKLSDVGWQQLVYPDQVISAIRSSGLKPEWMAAYKIKRFNHSPTLFAAPRVA